MTTLKSQDPRNWSDSCGWVRGDQCVCAKIGSRKAKSYKKTILLVSLSFDYLLENEFNESLPDQIHDGIVTNLENLMEAFTNDFEEAAPNTNWI